MERALSRYLRHHRTQGSTDKTLAYHRDSIGGLINFLRDQAHSLKIEDLTEDDISLWLEAQLERGLSPKTLRTRTISVKAWTRWLAGRDYLPKDPLAKLSPTKAPVKAVKHLTPEQVDTLLRATQEGRGANPARDRAVLITLFSTLIRAEELCDLELGDLDFDQGQIVIREGKGQKFRVVPMGTATDRAVTRYLDHPKRPKARSQGVFLNERGGVLPYQGLKMIFRRLEVRTGIHCNAHLWRHSGAVQYLRNGGKLEDLQKLLGHTTLEMTLHYGRVAGIDVTRAHATADPARSLKTRL